MKPRKKTILTMLLGLMLVASSAGMAQTTAQGDQKKNTEACCSMDSCKMKGKDSKNHADDHECCSCCGESCDMKHDGTMKHGAKGACCNVKQKKAA